MGRVIVRVLWGLAYWQFALVIAAAPVLWIPSNGLKNVGLGMFGKAYELAYRDLALLLLLILAVAACDAFESARLSLKTDSIVLLLSGILFLVILAMTILTAFSYTFSLADAVLPKDGQGRSPLREVIPIELPQVLIWAGFPLALAARLMAEATRNL